jgi:membrane associated rhomboid family serine protease
MPLPDSSEEAGGGGIPEDLVEAGIYATSAEGFDHGLVVLALGAPYWLIPDQGRYRLLVEPQAATAAREHLACFDRESAGWPPPPAKNLAPRKYELATPLLWALITLLAFCAQQARPGHWEAAADLDARAVFDRGEGWRLGTALFLHADFGHLISNELSGIFVFAAVISTIGRGRGWLLLALASLSGNLAIAALCYPSPYRSLGASTAIFAGLGLLTGRAIRLVRAAAPALSERRWAGRWRAVFVPLAAGATLLGLFGAGGMEVDVGAHFTGFGAGLIWGFAAGVSQRDL